MIYCPKGLPHSWHVVGNQKAKVDMGFFPSGMEMMLEELAGLQDRPPDLAVVGEICKKYGVRFV